ncbi:MAG: hypothetical protein JJU11_14050 [Candidatus Sumerlaeia bacterium]|nr:hypothetical protein [Candidatus Sumerlaeia bacterium]
MIDQDLERRYTDCSELVEAWKLMLDMINQAVKHPDAIDPQAEEQFLRAKARIAMLHDSFMDSLRHDKPIGTNMIEIVNRSITLRLMTRISEAESKKLEIEWHEVFLLLNETVSTLNEKRAELAEINEYVFRMGKVIDRMKTNFKSFLRSIYFKLIVASAVACVIIFGVPAAGIYDWDNLRDIRPLQPVISGTFWMGRAVGLTTPYFTLQEFSGRAFREPVGGLSHFNHTTDKPKADAARDIADVMMARVRDSDARTTVREHFETADNYEAFRIVTDGERDTAYLYLFWFRRVNQAGRVTTLLAPHTGDLDSDFQVTQKANVVAVLFARNQDFARRIQENRIDIMAP